MEDEVDNAEVLLQSSSNINYSHITDKNNNKPPNVNEIADDIAFIMRNTALHDVGPVNITSSESDSGSSDSDSDSSSDVKIITVPSKAKITICISTDDDSDNKETKDDKEISQKKDFQNNKTNKSSKKQEHKIHQDNSDDKPEDIGVICKLLMKNLVKTVARNRNENCEFDSEDEEDGEKEEPTEQDRMNFASIVNSETHVSDYIPKVQDEVFPEELEEEDEMIQLNSEDTLVPMGFISSVVEKMIVVEANKDAPALDADTAFFTEDKDYLGKVFDTFGPVKTPFYSIRLSGHVTKEKLCRGTRVYFVPFNKNITKYIFVEQLKNLKGSDASWKNDCEPPTQYLDYSDDEEERRAKRVEINRKRQLARDADEGSNGQGNNRMNNKAPKQQRQRKMKAIDLTKHGNPLLEHARLMNNPKLNKADALTRRNVEPSQQDVPLSSVMPVEVQDYDNSEMLQESRLDYVSPLHQSNPKPNWKNQRGRGRGGFGGRGAGRPAQRHDNGNETHGSFTSNSQQQHSNYHQQNNSFSNQPQNYEEQYNCNEVTQNFNGQYSYPPPPPSPQTQQQHPQPPAFDNNCHNQSNPYFNSFVDVSSNNINNYQQHPPSFPPNPPNGNQNVSSQNFQPSQYNGYTEQNFQNNDNNYGNHQSYQHGFNGNFNNFIVPPGNNFNGQNPAFSNFNHVNNQQRPNFNQQSNQNGRYQSQNFNANPPPPRQTQGPQRPNFNNHNSVPPIKNANNQNGGPKISNVINNQHPFNQLSDFSQNRNNHGQQHFSQPSFPNNGPRSMQTNRPPTAPHSMGGNSRPPFHQGGVRNNRPPQQNHINGQGY